MFLARLTFGPDGGKPRERDALKYAAESYLAALLKNGQIYGEYLCAWCDAILVAYTHVARPDALAGRDHSDWAKSALDSVVEGFGQPPKCAIIDDDVPKRFPSWIRSTSFYFMHRYWGGNDGEAVRPCPLCGGKWHSSGIPTDRHPFHDFHFRCKRCRLVSHCADSYDDQRHARIGAFKKAK